MGLRALQRRLHEVSADAARQHRARQLHGNIVKASSALQYFVLVFILRVNSVNHGTRKAINRSYPGRVTFTGRGRCADLVMMTSGLLELQKKQATRRLGRP